jgi:phosphoribosylaminoimidazole-succinocarboxamide synthase
MSEEKLLYEGKAKKVYTTADPDVLRIYYKDDATAFNGLKKGTITGKGGINNQISNLFFKLLEKNGIQTHLIKELSERETLVKWVSIIQLEVVVRNIACGSLSKRLGWEEGRTLNKPIVEFYYKCDALDDPFINEMHIEALGVATKEEVDLIRAEALKINAILRPFLADIGVTLVDFKLEFGRTRDGKVILADEISPDTCRFWDSATGSRLDKDRFRREMGGEEEAYQEMFKRVSAKLK